MILIICGDDLAKVDRDRVRIMLRGTQLADGRFCCVSAQSSDGVAESDIRFVYCAAVIAAVFPAPLSTPFFTATPGHGYFGSGTPQAVNSVRFL